MKEEVWVNIRQANICQDFYYPMKINGKYYWMMVGNEWGDMSGYGTGFRSFLQISGSDQDKHEILVLKEACMDFDISEMFKNKLQ